ncbi:hypothetical protein D3C72_2396350 [compost metagenome]
MGIGLGRRRGLDLDLLATDSIAVQVQIQLIAARLQRITLLKARQVHRLPSAIAKERGVEFDRFAGLRRSAGQTRAQ